MRYLLLLAAFGLVAQAAPAGSSTFASPAAQSFLVKGADLPEINVLSPVDSYAGRLPIASGSNKNLFFWMWPTSNTAYSKNLIFYFNGGPGCSSMEAALQEVGPYVKRPGSSAWVKNSWSWSDYGNLVMVDQPAGTGFSVGKSDINNCIDLSREFTGWLQQFMDTFPELKGSNLYMTGESYAGFYVPYISKYIKDNGLETPLGLSLQGIWLANPTMSYYSVQAQVPAAQWARDNANILGFDQAFLKKITGMEQNCGYDKYLKTWLTYPASKKDFPVPNNSPVTPVRCNLWSVIKAEAKKKNPAFDQYHISEGWPGLSDNLQESPIYLQNSQVRKVLHVEDGPEWKECGGKAFIDQNQSVLSSLIAKGATKSVMGEVIDASTRSVIVHGVQDFVFLDQGTRLALQNMTWGGCKGFTNAPKADSFSVPGYGTVGTVQIERKLALATVTLSGHAVPQFSPWSAYQLLKWLVGVEKTL